MPSVCVASTLGAYRLKVEIEDVRLPVERKGALLTQTCSVHAFGHPVQGRQRRRLHPAVDVMYSQGEPQAHDAAEPAHTTSDTPKGGAMM